MILVQIHEHLKVNSWFSTVYIFQTESANKWIGCYEYVYMYEKLLYCSHVWMALGKISCELTGSPSFFKVFEFN